MSSESHGLRGPDICPGLKIPILQERNPDERPGHIIPFILLDSESPLILLSEVENTQNEPISTSCLPLFDSAQGKVRCARSAKNRFTCVILAKARRCIHMLWWSSLQTRPQVEQAIPTRAI
jgi:hypothetical protein